MVEPLTAAAIATLAFETVIRTGVGEATKATAKKLWQKIRGKVKEEGVEEAVLVEVENSQSQEILAQKIVPFLQVAMLKDSQFAQEVQNIAQQIKQEINEGSQDRIEQKDFEAHDNSVIVGKVENAGNIGGTHLHLGKN